MNREIKLALCLICGWQRGTKEDISSANWYGECLECNESFLRWDFEDGSILITNGKTDQEIKWEAN